MSLFKSALPRGWPAPALGRCSHQLLRSRSLSTRSSPGRIDADAQEQQAMPVGRYYEIILDQPTPYATVNSDRPPASANASKAAASMASKRSPRATRQPKAGGPVPAAPGAIPPAPSIQDEAPAQARIIFSSSLAGPAERAERLAAIRSQSTMVAGVRVPPRPDEPDNCCMSGCVNCVWDRYREEMEEWAAANAEAERRLRAQDAGLTGVSQADVRADSAVEPSIGDGGDDGTQPAQSTAKIAKDLWDEELYANIPVGVREFMRLEKKLKQKHAEEGTTGG